MTLLAMSKSLKEIVNVCPYTPVRTHRVNVMKRTEKVIGQILAIICPF